VLQDLEKGISSQLYQAVVCVFVVTCHKTWGKEKPRITTTILLLHGGKTRSRLVKFFVGKHFSFLQEIITKIKMGQRYSKRTMPHFVQCYEGKGNHAMENFFSQTGGCKISFKGTGNGIASAITNKTK